ncbi:hypothetical protein NMX13_18925 [Dickeya zeae]|nr:hypothetical protein NMX13_18925 [Dickeya zeae]
MLPVAARLFSLDTRHTSRCRCVDVTAALAVLLALQGRNALTVQHASVLSCNSTY